MPTKEIACWVWTANVRMVFEYLSAWVSGDFGDTSWETIEQALPGTSWEPPEKWHVHTVEGAPSMTVRLAREPGAGLVYIQVRGDMDDILSARVDTMLCILADLRPDPAPVKT